MCTANSVIIAAVKNIMDLRKMQEELVHEIEKNEAIVKSFMDNQQAEAMVAGNYTVSYKTVVSTRVDTTALKKLLGAEALEPYTKRVESRRFSIK